MAGEEEDFSLCYYDLMAQERGMGEEGGRRERGKFRRTIGGGMGRQTWRLYVIIKFNIITVTTRPRTEPVNKQDGKRYISKDADLRLFVLLVYLFCMMAQFTIGSKE